MLSCFLSQILGKWRDDINLAGSGTKRMSRQSATRGRQASIKRNGVVFTPFLYETELCVNTMGLQWRSEGSWSMEDGNIITLTCTCTMTNWQSAQASPKREVFAILALDNHAPLLTYDVWECAGSTPKQLRIGCGRSIRISSSNEPLAEISFNAVARMVDIEDRVR